MSNFNLGIVFGVLFDDSHGVSPGNPYVLGITPGRYEPLPERLACERQESERLLGRRQGTGSG
jgi:hypothetical protein